MRLRDLSVAWACPDFSAFRGDFSLFSVTFSRMPDAAVYGPPSLDQALGSLPVVASFLDQLNVAAIIDELCPIRDVALATHGQVVEAMIASRLTSPTPLVRVIDWARAWAVEHCFGISPQFLNDDRLGRTLDAIAPHLDQIVGTVGATAITQFGLDVSQIHWDMTSISLYGAYEQAEEGYARPKFGHPKDRRPDLKQIQTGIGTSADGGIPVYHRAYDGGAAEVSQVTGAMTALKDMAAQRSFLLIGDSKLISYPNVRDITGAKVAFIAPAPEQHVAASVLAACDLDKAVEVDYTARRDAGKPTDRRGTWRVYEDTMVLSPPKRATGPDITLRRVFVHSTARAAAAQTARAKKLARASDDLDRLRRGLGSRHYPDEAAVRNRLAVIGKTRQHRYRHRKTRPDLGIQPAGTAGGSGHRRLVCAADQSRPSRGRHPRCAAPLQRPGSLRTPIRQLQGPTGGRALVLATQPADRSIDHRDLPGLAGVLPHRTPDPHPDRTTDQDPRPLCRTPRPAHWLADLPRPRRDTTHPRHRRSARGHPTAHTAAAASAGAPRGRSAETSMIKEASRR